MASSVLTLPGGKAVPALVASQTSVAVIGGDGQILEAGWTRGVEQAIGWADSAAGDSAAVLVAGPPLVVRDVPGQWVYQTQAGPLEGKRRYDECPFVPGWRACSSCAWPDCPAGDNPTAAATTSDGRAGLHIDGRRGNQPASSHGRRYAQPDREQPSLTRRYPR